VITLTRRSFTVALLCLLALSVTLSACTSPAPVGPTHFAGGPKGTIVVGVSGAFTENQLVAEMYAQVLERAGYKVQREFDLRSREISQNALESGQIDLKPEYLSSLLLFLDRNAEPSGSPADVFPQAFELLRQRGITLLVPSRAQDTNQFVANAQTAERFGLTTMSSIAPVAGQLTLGGPPECPQRPLCIYGILFNDFKALDAGGPQTVDALKANQVQIGLLFSTDPSIEANGFVPLVDDKQLQNAENITPIIRSDKLNGEIRRLLEGVSAKLSSQKVTDLIGEVVIDGRSVSAVAKEFLAENV
jgi:osmoprotectant transport system substrate-binding protein